jgi:hypothetical protein
LLPGGNEQRARTIGLVEICNIGGTAELGDYAVVLKKCPPFAGALRQAWRRARISADENGPIDSAVQTARMTRSSSRRYRAITAPDAVFMTCSIGRWSPAGCPPVIRFLKDVHNDCAGDHHLDVCPSGGYGGP